MLAEKAKRRVRDESGMKNIASEIGEFNLKQWKEN